MSATELSPAELELIHAYHDGELPLDGRGEAEALLQRSAEAHAELAQLRRLTDALAGLVEVEPPPQLSATLLSGLAANDPGVEPVRKTGGGPTNRQPQYLRYAAVLLAGIALTTLIYRAGSQSEADPHHVGGTMLGAPRSVGDLLDTATYESSEIRGEVRLYRAAGGRYLEIDLRASAPLEVVIEDHGSTTRRSVAVGTGLMPTVAVSDGSTPITVSVLVGGQKVRENTLGAVPAHR